MSVTWNPTKSAMLTFPQGIHHKYNNKNRTRMRTFISLQGKHVFSQGDPEQRGQRLFGGLFGHL